MLEEQENFLERSTSEGAFEIEQSYLEWDVCILFDNVDLPRDKDGNPLPEASKAYKEWLFRFHFISQLFTFWI